MPKQVAYNPWESVWRFAREIQQNEFMAEILARRDARGAASLMGKLDCALLYGLVRWQRPATIVESGGNLGMSSAFILQALADERVSGARLYSVECNSECSHGALIPDRLREAFVPVAVDTKELVKGDQLPARLDMFLHDSSHRYRHMMLEYETFWERLADGGLLASHDVHFSSAFPTFVARTYAHDKGGLLDAEACGHYEWGRWGYLGFVLKEQS